MSYTGYIVWFIAMAVLIAGILAVGILHMAGILPPDHHDEHADVLDAAAPDDEHDHDTHHHWWHRAA